MSCRGRTYHPTTLPLDLGWEEWWSDLLWWTEPYWRGIRLNFLGKKNNLQSIVECNRSTKGMRRGGVRMNRRRCPRMKSELHNDISTILTMNSRAGWDMAYEPSPRPCQRPVHHARLDSSCCNSRERNTAIRNFITALWIAIIAIRPSTAWDASHSSRNHCELEESMKEK